MDLRDPSNAYASYALQLVGRTNYPVQVAPAGRAIIKIGERDYGPVQADASGLAAVPILVPPGVSVATLLSISPGGALTESRLNLKVPETKRVAWFPAPAEARGAGPIQVQALVVTPDGKPDEAAAPKFRASHGQISAVRYKGNGIYAAIWTPPAVTAPLAASLVVSLGSAVQEDALGIRLLP